MAQLPLVALFISCLHLCLIHFHSFFVLFSFWIRQLKAEASKLMKSNWKQASNAVHQQSQANGQANKYSNGLANGTGPRLGNTRFYWLHDLHSPKCKRTQSRWQRQWPPFTLSPRFRSLKKILFLCSQTWKTVSVCELGDGLGLWSGEGQFNLWCILQSDWLFDCFLTLFCCFVLPDVVPSHSWKWQWK